MEVFSIKRPVLETEAVRPQQRGRRLAPPGTDVQRRTCKKSERDEHKDLKVGTESTTLLKNLCLLPFID